MTLLVFCVTSQNVTLYERHLNLKKGQGSTFIPEDFLLERFVFGSEAVQLVNVVLQRQRFPSVPVTLLHQISYLLV